MTVATAARSTPLLHPPLAEVLARLERVLAASPADDTELVWLDVTQGLASSGEPETSAAEPVHRHTVEIRVGQAGRRGFHRTGARRASELENAVRFALGQAQLAAAEPPAARLDLARADTECGEPVLDPTGDALRDPAIADLDPARAAALLAAGRGTGDRLHLAWWELRLAIANSGGLRRTVAATAVTLAATHTTAGGTDAGTGHAAGSARSLAALAAPAIVERARAQAADGAAESLPSAALGELPVVLAPEAAAALVAHLGRTGLAAAPFREGISFLAGEIDRQVFAPAFSLRDDGTDPAGLPFPVDSTGAAKRPVEMVTAGVLRSPAVDAALGTRLGLRPTAHAVAPGEARPDHLFVAPGQADLSALLAAAEGGLWICRLDRLHGGDPLQGSFRAIARGVRRITGGALGAALPDLAWRGSLPQLLGTLAAVGSEPVVLADDPWGAVSSPALAFPASSGFALAD